MSRKFLFSTAGYGVVSLIASTLNKIVMTKFFFDYPIVIAMLQMAITLIAIELLRFTDKIKVMPYNFQRGRDMLVPSLLYALSAYFSLNSLEGITMPMFPSVKRFCPVAVLLFSHYVLRTQRPCNQMIASVSAVSIGSAMACFYEFSLDQWSLLYGIAAFGMQAASFVLIENLANQYSTLDLIYMNSFNCLVFFLLADLIQDELRDSFMYFITSSSTLFTVCLAALIIFGVLMHCFAIMCICKTNALMTTVVGNVRAALQTFVAYSISVYLFYDYAPTFLNFVGLVIAIAGAVFVVKLSRNSQFRQGVSLDRP
uniref:TPT domain-containing protein n=1 Tax=Steinernema glaseri TaxID=37863 RepID=A0A1I7XYH1_9BILA